MKIVILDGYTINPGDLSWSGLEKYGELKRFIPDTGSTRRTSASA